MPNDDHRDIFFYPALTLMIDFYSLIRVHNVCFHGQIILECIWLYTDDLISRRHITSVRLRITTAMPAKSDSDFMFCLQTYQGLIIDISHVY